MIRGTASIVLALAATSCIVGENSLPPPPRTGVAALGAQLYGLNMPADGSRSAIAADLGARWVRVELVDHSTGLDLAGNVAALLDATLDDYHARGMNVLLIVDYSSYGGNTGFGPDGACGDWPGWHAGWLARISRVAQVYGSRVDAWQIWNEPDHPIAPCNSRGYNPGVPALEYGIMLRDAYTTIRDAGAVAPIITGGLDSGQVSYVFEASSGVGGLWADGVAVHPYGVVPDASWCPSPGEDLNCEWGTLGGKVDEYHAATGLPVWITEFGLRTLDTLHAARYLESAYAAFEGRGAAVAHVFYFCESDAMVPPFGLSFADGTPKPHMYAAYQRVTSGAGGGGGGGGSGGGGLTQQLHGTVEAGGAGIPGLQVTAWGHAAGDFHVAVTDALGIYQFIDLTPTSRYNVVVNAQFDPSSPDGYVPVNGAHAYEVRDNVELVSGPDGWHGENFGLPF